MNKFTRIASRIVISLLVITICCCGVTSNLWSDDYGFHGETDYVELKNEHMYEMRFCNLAEDIAYIGAEFLLPPNRDGSLSIGIRTEDGREIATDFTFDLNQFSSDLVSLRVLSISCSIKTITAVSFIISKLLFIYSFKESFKFDKFFCFPFDSFLNNNEFLIMINFFS